METSASAFNNGQNPVPSSGKYIQNNKADRSFAFYLFRLFLEIFNLEKSKYWWLQ